MASDAPPDAELVRGIARGDQASLGGLYDRHASLLLAIGRRILRDPREAEDVLHDVFLEVWQRAGDYDPGRSAVRTWLTLRMRSRCLDRMKSARATRVVSLEADGIPEPSVEPAAPGRSDLGSLQVALTSLSEAQRQVIELGYFRGLSCSEIGRELGVPIGTVKSRVAAALGKLREAVAASPEVSR